MFDVAKRMPTIEKAQDEEWLDTEHSVKIHEVLAYILQNGFNRGKVPPKGLCDLLNVSKEFMISFQLGEKNIGLIPKRYAWTYSILRFM
uniref:Uncharacterized protein n=1 Tax=Trichogramma kaykai TaxID=54128 RepID=A0ABD2WPF3_9HYME